MISFSIAPSRPWICYLNTVLREYQSVWTYRTSEIPEIHVHVSALAIRWCREVGIVLVARILHLDRNAIIALAAISVVVVLEAVGGLFTQN